MFFRFFKVEKKNQRFISYILIEYSLSNNLENKKNTRDLKFLHIVNAVESS